MDLINTVDLHLIEGVSGAMQLDIDLTYKLAMNSSFSSQEL